jgi:phage terminase large subunit
MQIRFPNGSKIIFKGMDKPAKLKSINNISLVWLEECSEIKYDGFKELLGRLRHPSIKLHMILSTNPVSKSNWSYTHFFSNPLKDFFVLDDERLYKEKTLVIGDTYYHHSTAEDNMFLPQSYVDQLDELKIHDPDLYRVARQGRFGVNGTLVLPQFEKASHEDVMEAINNIDKPLFKNGMDFGFVESYNALVKMAVDKRNQVLYIYWEYYKNNTTDDKTVQELADQKKILIKADSAEPKTIQFFRQSGFRMMPTRKFAGSRIQYTKKVKRFKKIICSDECPNTFRELHDLTFKTDKTTGEIIEDEFNIDPHTFSAIWYGLDDYEVTALKGDSVRN